MNRWVPAVLVICAWGVHRYASTGESRRSLVTARVQSTVGGHSQAGRDVVVGHPAALDDHRFWHDPGAAFHPHGQRMCASGCAASNHPTGKLSPAHFDRLLRCYAVERMASRGEGQEPLEVLLQIANRGPELERAVAHQILAAGPRRLVRLSLRATDPRVRRSAAGFLASWGARHNGYGVAAELLSGLAFDPQAKAPPWEGGPLFLPAVTWSPEDARALAGLLIEWRLWCELQQRPAVRRQIDTNLRSVSLSAQAGYRMQNSMSDWLREWERVSGKDEVRAMVSRQNAWHEYADERTGS